MTTNWMGLGETYTVRMEDGEELTVTTKMVDVVKLERINNGASHIAGVPSVTDLLSLLWLALRRTGQIEDKDRAAWALKVGDFGRVADDDGDGQDDGVGPTE